MQIHVIGPVDVEAAFSIVGDEHDPINHDGHVGEEQQHFELCSGLPQVVGLVNACRERYFDVDHLRAHVIAEENEIKHLDGQAKHVYVVQVAVPNDDEHVSHDDEDTTEQHGQNVRSERVLEQKRIHGSKATYYTSLKENVLQFFATKPGAKNSTVNRATVTSC